MRSQFVLDDKTEELLNELAAGRAGNRSFVVREAIQLYANLESWLDTVETDPGLQEMMALSQADIEAGRVLNTEQLMRHRAQPRKRSLGTRRAAKPAKPGHGAPPRKVRNGH